MYEVAGFVNSHFPNANVVLVRNTKVKLAAEADIFKEQMLSFLTRQNNVRLYKEVVFATEGINGIAAKLSDSKPNVLIVLSDEEAVVSDILRKID